MRNIHRFQVGAAASGVCEFHRAPRSQALITPSLLRLDPRPATRPLEIADEIAFHVRLGSSSIPWAARVESPDESGVCDRPLRGPFESWGHRHRSIPLGRGRSEVRDEIEARLHRDPVSGRAGLDLWIGLPIPFAVGGWKIRLVLEAR